MTTLTDLGAHCVFTGGEGYCLHKKLGQGGFATVYACEPIPAADEDSMDLDQQELVVKVCM